MISSDELRKVPGGNFMVAKDETDIEYDEFGRPVLSFISAGTAGEVKSVQGKKGRVQLTTDDIPDGTITKQLTNELKQKILDNETHVQILDNEMGDAQRDIATNKRDITTVRTALQSKQDLVVGAASTVVEDNLTPNKLVVTNTSGKIESSIRGEEALVPAGGQANQVLMKNTNNDYDVKWEDMSQAQAPVTSVNAKIGNVVLTQDDIADGNTFVQTHNDFTDDEKIQIETNKTDVTSIKQQLTTINTKLNQKISKSGDTMTGSLTLSGPPTTNNMAATKKYVDDNIGEKIPEHTVAEAGKILKVDANGDVEWGDAPDAQNGLPVGGTLGQTLVKNSNNNYDVVWQSVTTLPAVTLADVGKVPVAQNNGIVAWNSVQAQNGVPAGGDENQYLKKSSNTDYDTEWVDAPMATNGIPTGGTAGQVLVKNNETDYQTSWTTVRSVPNPPANTSALLTVNTNGTIYWDSTGGSVLEQGKVPGIDYYLSSARDTTGAIVPVWKQAPGNTVKPYSAEAIPAQSVSGVNSETDYANLVKTMPVESMALFCTRKRAADSVKDGNYTLVFKGASNTNATALYFTDEYIRFFNANNFTKGASYIVNLKAINRKAGSNGAYYGFTECKNGVVTWTSNAIAPQITDLKYDEWLNLVQLSSSNCLGTDASNYYPSQSIYGHFTYGDLWVDTLNGYIKVRFNSFLDPDGTKQLYKKTDGCGSLSWVIKD